MAITLLPRFAEVGLYAKLQPSLMPNVASSLRHITRSKYIIQSDLTIAFYQIPLKKSSIYISKILRQNIRPLDHLKNL